MIITQKQILEITGYNNIQSAKKCLQEQGILVITGKNGRIFTTLDAFNNVLINTFNENITLGQLSDGFLKSDQFLERSTRTQSDYIFHSRILQYPFNQQLLSQFLLSEITTPFIRQLLDARASMFKANDKTYVSANRELAYLSCVFTWGLQYKELSIITNPCLGIKKKLEIARNVYISGAGNRTGHYSAGYELANEREQIIMELMYLTACRGQEVLNMLKSDRQLDGLLVRRLKGSKTNIVYYSDRLNIAITRAMALHTDLTNIYLIPGINGNQVIRSTLSTAMQRLNKKCRSSGIEPIRLHDLKATGYTDGNDDKLTGHKSEAMRNKYRVLPEKVMPSG